MKVLLLILFICFSPLTHSKVSKDTKTPKMKSLLNKAIAENKIFRCSFNQTINSNLKGQKLKVDIQKKCQKEIANIKKWFPKKADNNKRVQRLISNGIRSASPHRTNL